MEPPDSPPWPTWKCVGFRLLLVYFVIFAFPFPLTWVPGVGAWLDAARGQVWLAVIESTVLPADLAMLLTMLVPALVISLSWSIVDRKSSGTASGTLAGGRM